ncbi:diphosphate--fructose-6-phosphate 1-phosphotransferase [Ktedonosporobacter rubrisoli]|uniref:Pyrophosphate--fructose 6-phosphate 1-phosphotransferase n=1 Tax=Ktedonosporobacter rubrisoli TaxID=2509675 RepID=A0A4P6JTL7_KTERU|nr:diphosphate--fructose-6-phosphate 1-phosphotransferase [Ktedonosporobacter rubrisoli]QBD78929.1 diphosphate--fructose-6-phosphate 1-phosphotransferase [Ktedonosporobacter rubrisoli]
MTSTTAHNNLLIGQSGGATAVINASVVGAFEAACADARIDEIYGMHNGIEGFLREDLLDLRKQPPDLWHRLLYTPGAALGSCRYKLTEDDQARLIELLRCYHIRYLVYIGGNDSADTVHRLAQAAQHSGYELGAVSIPKTIDNDLPCTDHTLGYGSAARFIAQAVLDSTLNMRSLPELAPAVKVIETQGRDSGWLVAASTLGKHKASDPPHMLLVPEQAFVQEQFLEQLEEIYRRLGYAVVVTSEALRDAAGQPVGETDPTAADAFGHPLFYGAASTLAKIIKQRLHVRAHSESYGDLQWSSISRIDREEAQLAGKEAIEQLLEGESDKMITLIREKHVPYQCHLGTVELSRVANLQRPLPAEYLDTTTKMTTRAFQDYAQPLLGSPLPDYPQLS